MKIAIVGSGIAGLSAAWLLGRHHQVTLFERHSRPGMGAHNLDYTFSNQTVRIDVPIRAFNQCHYRNLVKFYDLMGVDTLRTDHSAAYSHPSQKAPFSPTVTSILVAAQSRGQPAGDTCPSIRPALRQMPSVFSDGPARSEAWVNGRTDHL